MLFKKTVTFMLAFAIGLTMIFTSVMADENTAYQHTTIDEADYGNTYKYLFIGNSITYYNNLPQVYAEMVSVKTGDTIDVTTALYGSRNLLQHGNAFAAMERSGGDDSNLTDDEKCYFAMGGYNSDPDDFDTEVYEDYKEAVFDDDDQVKKYDYIVIQEMALEYDYEDAKAGIEMILKAISHEDANILINAPHARIYDDTSVNYMETELAKKESYLEKIRDDLKEDQTIPFKSINIVYTGRSELNYYKKTGVLDAAQKLAPDEYIVQTKNGIQALKNDTVLPDGIHPTQLGTYMQACTYYSTVYGRNAVETADEFDCDVEAAAWNINNQEPGNSWTKAKAESKYKYVTGGIMNQEMLLAAGNIAFATYQSIYGSEQSHPTREQSNYLDDGQPVYDDDQLETPVLKKASVTDKGIKIKWEPVEGAAAYRVYRKSFGGWYTIGITKKASFTDKKTYKGLEHTYTVRCVSEDGYTMLSGFDEKGISATPESD